MKSWSSTLGAAALAVALAGCMEKLPSQWGFRYEDRDKVIEAADKLEALATNLYTMSRRPLDYSAKPESAGLNAIRFFTAEAARFHRTARAWQPGSQDIGYAYTNLTDRWASLRNDTGTLQAHEQARAYIQRINELMQDLGRLTDRGSPTAAPRGPAATGLAKPAEPRVVEPPAQPPAPARPEPAAAPVTATAMPQAEPVLPAAPRVQPPSETPPVVVPAAQTAPPPLPEKPAAAPQPPPLSTPASAPDQPAPPPPPAPKPPPDEKPPLLPPLSPIAPNPALR